MSTVYSLTTDVLKKMPTHIETVIFGMGCFWGVERLFWQQEGVWGTATGYSGGATSDPSYEEVCSGDTQHAEVVLVAYDPSKISFKQLLTIFWEHHDPTQGMRQGNDIGSQYRSVIYCSTASQLEMALESKQAYQSSLSLNGYGTVTTEISLSTAFFFAEEYHQRYLLKNPNGYCGLRGTGAKCSL